MTPEEKARLDQEIEQLEWEIGWKTNELALLRAKRYRVSDWVELPTADKEVH